MLQGSRRKKRNSPVKAEIFVNLADEELEKLVEWLGRVRGTNQDQ